MKKMLIGFCIAAMLLAACGSSEGTEAPTAIPPTDTAVTQQGQQTVPSPEPGGEQVTIRFAVFDFQRSLYEDLIQAFEEANADVAVQIVSTNEVLGLQSLTDFDLPEDATRRLVSAADVIAQAASREDVQQGLVRDLTPFIEADANFQIEDFYANALERHQWEGGTWSLPTTLSAQLIFFNKDAFDQAGEPYPEIGWSWDDFLAKAKAVTVGDGDQVSLWGFVPSDTTHRTLVESRAGLVIDDATDPPTPRLDEPEVVDAVRWYASLFLTEQVAPYFEPQEDTGELALPEEQVLIDKGQAGMWPDSDILWWYRNQQGNVGAMPFPVDSPDAQSNPIGTQAVSMSAGTEQPQAAWQFLDFLSRQVQPSLGPGMQSLPARRSTAETSGYWDDLDEELSGALRYAVDHGYRPRWLPGHQAFADAMKAILSGEQSVEDALAEAQIQAETQIQEYMAARADATPAPTVVVAPPEQEAPAGEGVQAITFIPGLGSLNLDPYRDLAERFSEAHPDIAVEVKMIDLMGGSAPTLPSLARTSDCFQWYPGFQEAEAREAILPLDPFLDADPSFTTEDFYPQVLDQFRWQGQLLGLPADITPYVVEYNQDLFDAAGVDYPALDWTTDDFLSTAVALTQGEDEETKQYGFVPQTFELNDMVFLLAGRGAKLVDQDADPPALSYNDPDTVDAVRWYVSLTTEHGVKPIFLTDISKLAGASALVLEREALINEGRGAMWTSTGATAGLFGEREGLTVGTVPVPADPGVAGGGYSGASGFFISADAENPLACWQWLTFLSGEPGAVQNALPARRSVAESDAYLQQMGASRAEAYLASVGEGEVPSTFQIFSDEPWLNGALYWLGQAYDQVLTQGVSLEEALDAVQTLADDYRACVIAAGDFSTESWQGCLKEIDPTLPDFLFVSGG
jgi:multiple sugar transport system substrate-binding protein